MELRTGRLNPKKPNLSPIDRSIRPSTDLRIASSGETDILYFVYHFGSTARAEE
jgi:hypothetical protein